MTNVANLIGGGDKANRSPNDYYPTPPEVTVALMDFLTGQGIEFYDIWEPACGEGDMLQVLQRYTPKEGHVVGTDITHPHPMLRLDYIGHRQGTQEWVITNPPFSLSKGFITQALDDMDKGTVGVAMLTKATFWNVARNLPLFNRRKPRWILPLTWRPQFDKRRWKGSDVYDPDLKSAPMLDMCWTVWYTNPDDITEYIPLQKPKD
jgi:hypothetical protein